ncbi:MULTISPECIES: O-antigen ligase family protein [Vibrio]|jgi:O-antigen ligase|uniref:O-antigen ligase family protein n=1 Tax=Vibrio kanaloae TaxID=170673 RepID=A0A4U1ZKU3_9VIBR|nr:O-antigen ligase family protein [Vibrio kanaloae]TKF02050.1 O-antigen ligase family protein [Vibrio kanaloae]TKF19175.1 O-antigen ligase family protein [Vibrio kanaloae]TKF25880.1 O-antigen ligase family protein [Vibrio kanaloae]TKF34146.1 O-antigen ligase family protein [Vibrio kanaloae]TKF80524.1 O-antigen ligase family protein [Vibrio kanaloae]
MFSTHLYHTKAVSFFAACFPVICVAYGSGYNYSSILLLASCIVSVIFTYKEIKLSSNEKLFIYALLYYFLTFLLLKLVHGEKWSFIDKPSRALLTIPIFVALLRYPPSWKSMAIGINIASICSAIVALYFLQNYPELRAFDGRIPNAWFEGYMQIQTGGMVTTFAISSLAIALFEAKNKNHLFSIISLIAFALGAWASLQSESRGSWLLVPLATLVIIHYKFNLLRIKVILLTIASISIAVASLSTNDTVTSRVNEALSDYNQYNSSVNAFTSVGIRLNLWKSASITFLENPLVGAGTDERLEKRKSLGDAGIIDKQVSRMTYHDHNQFLEAASVTGIVGLSALVAIFLVPLSLFFKILNRSSPCESAKNFSLLGIISVILMIGYCLTQAFFNHNSGTIFYLVWTSILLSSSMKADNKHHE